MGKIKETLDCYFANSISTTDIQSGLTTLTYSGLLEVIKSFNLDSNEPEQLSLRRKSFSGYIDINDFISDPGTERNHEVLDDAI